MMSGVRGGVSARWRRLRVGGFLPGRPRQVLVGRRRMLKEGPQPAQPLAAGRGCVWRGGRRDSQSAEEPNAEFVRAPLANATVLALRIAPGERGDKHARGAVLDGQPPPVPPCVVRPSRSRWPSAPHPSALGRGYPGEGQAGARAGARLATGLEVRGVREVTGSAVQMLRRGQAETLHGSFALAPRWAWAQGLLVLLALVPSQRPFRARAEG